MERTPRMGSMAVARASTMLRSGGMRPTTRRTRTACRLVARLGDGLGTMVRAMETATTRASKRFQGLLTKGRYLERGAIMRPCMLRAGMLMVVSRRGRQWLAPALSPRFIDGLCNCCDASADRVWEGTPAPVGEGVDSQVESEGRDEEDVQAVEEEGELGPALVRRTRHELSLDDGGDEVLPPHAPR